MKIVLATDVGSVNQRDLPSVGRILGWPYFCWWSKAASLFTPTRTNQRWCVAGQAEIYQHALNIRNVSCVFFDSGTLKLVKWSGQFSVDCHRQFVILGLGKVRRPSGLSHNSGREGVGGGAWGEGGGKREERTAGNYKYDHQCIPKRSTEPLCRSYRSWFIIHYEWTSHSSHYANQWRLSFYVVMADAAC